MCLKRAFSGYLAYFFEVGLRGDAQGPKHRTEESIDLVNSRMNTLLLF